MLQHEIAILAALRKSRIQSECVTRQAQLREQGARRQIANLRKFAHLKEGRVQLNVCALADRLERELNDALA